MQAVRPGKPQHHPPASSTTRRDFLKASTISAAAAAGIDVFAAPAAAPQEADRPLPDSGRPGRRYVIRDGYVMSMDPLYREY